MTDDHYMNRCLQLALLGQGYVAPNPMVGAVLVHEGKIIGEGYHEFYGGAHAEVNCFASVSDEHQKFVGSSTLYVSLEPCSHFGKTPPCADRIVMEKVKTVVIACRDPFSKVNGQGIAKLQAAGIEVREGVLQQQAEQLNKYFFQFHLKKRPYVFLKWAQTNDGFIAGPDFQQLAISNELTNRFTHRLRATVGAIMVGTNTALYDQPSLTSRLWPGKNPMRVVIDKRLQIPATSALLNNNASVVVINCIKQGQEENIHFLKVGEHDNVVALVLDWLYQNNISSVLIEGGTQLLQSFLDAGSWDEAMIIRNRELTLPVGGIAAPQFVGGKPQRQFQLRTDDISIYKNQ